MRATLHDLALLHHQNLVGAAYGGKPVRNHKRSPALHEIRESLLDHLFRFGVEAGSCLVEDQYARLGQDGAGNRNTLALAAGKLHAAFPDNRVVLFSESLGELVHPRDPAGAQDLFFAGIGTGKRNVLADCAVE